MAAGGAVGAGSFTDATVVGTTFGSGVVGAAAAAGGGSVDGGATSGDGGVGEGAGAATAVAGGVAAGVVAGVVSGAVATGAALAVSIFVAGGGGTAPAVASDPGVLMATTNQAMQATATAAPPAPASNFSRRERSAL